ncbi:hypothetical protein BDR06DRAFT_971056 [Suillus hirtellus]|nr:hypothetical protein BDR06DRAFT_971056 [Suillus hirtellus]
MTPHHPAWPDNWHLTGRSAVGISTTGNCGLYMKEVFRDLGIRPDYLAMEKFADHEAACLQDLTLTYKTAYASAAKFENVCARDLSGYPKSLSITHEKQPSPSVKLPVIYWKLRAIVHLCHFERRWIQTSIRMATSSPIGPSENWIQLFPRAATVVMTLRMMIKLSRSLIRIRSK